MLEIDLTDGNWFDGLPQSQNAAILHMLDSGKSEDEIGSFWLSAAGSGSTAGFGAGTINTSFFDNVKREFIAFVCGDAKYKAEQTQASKVWK